jgi:hypothetical protein
MLREPVQIVELVQRRCGLRFGVGDCTATGAPMCYQTWTTCPVRAVYDSSGSIAWRFVANGAGIWPIGDQSDPDVITTNAFPVDGLTVSTASGSLNAAGVLDGKSPAGARSRVTVTMADFPWADPVGDFYLGDRVDLPERMFWAVWAARNAFFGGMTLNIYDGYRGDALGDMSKRAYVVDKFEGPDGSGRVSITGLDPLVLSTNQKAKFPEEMDVRLPSAITSGQVTIRVQTGEPAKLTKSYGNLTGIYHLRIGNEVLSYTGVTTIEDGVYDLTGCVRGVVGTAASATADTRCQRVGRYVDIPTWEIGYDLLVNHTPLPAAYVDHAVWADEGDTYLPTLRSTVWIMEPTLVDDLMGECCQQGMFYYWWDERTQSVPMLAVRPPKASVARLDWRTDILASSVELRREPESLLTRVFVYYDPRDPFASRTAASNYRVVSGRIEGSTEHPDAAGGPRPLSIYARFVSTEAHAVQIIQRIISRYSVMPRFVSLRLDSKNKEITIGDVCDLTARELVDSEGRLLADRWQVISWSEVRHGEVYLIDLQTYDYIGAFAFWMADGAPDWEDATDEQRALGAWWADDDGKYPDGTPGHQWN